MAQVRPLPVVFRKPETDTLAEKLGTGLGKGLQSLAQHRLKGLAQRQELQKKEQERGTFRSALEALKLPQDIADIPDPKLQLELLKSSLMGREDEGVSESVEDILSGLTPQEEVTQPGLGLEALQPTEEPTEEPSKKLLPEVTTPVSTQEQISKLPFKMAPGGRADLEEERLDNYLAKSKLSARKKDKIRGKFEKRAEKFEEKQDKIDKATFEDWKGIQKMSKGSREMNRDLARQKEILIESGQPAGFGAAFIDFIDKKWGFNFKSIFTADAQEFDKISKAYLRNISDFFPGRILTTEIENFLKTVPSLSNSLGGNLRIIDNLTRINDMQMVIEKTANEIIDENRGFRPRNFVKLINERARDQLDEMSKAFIKDQRKPLKTKLDLQSYIPIETIVQ